jgi:branched-chain amino acid transport system ATP-binding protein
MDEMALQTQQLCKTFGALRVTNSVDLKIRRGARHALIGPNGAGKSTLINLLTGTIRPSSGKIFLNGERLDGLPVEGRVRLGLGRTFQVNSLFPHLTPLEATTLAVCRRHGVFGNPMRALGSCTESIDEAYELLRSVRLADEYNKPTSKLAYGRQRLLEIALALAGRPNVLLLDEPAAGVPPGESFELMEAIEALPSEIAVLFIEHDMDLVFRFAEKITVLVAGNILREGTVEEITSDPEVLRAYLGTDAHV